MSNNFPRVPVRFLESNQELLKSQAGIGPQSGGAGVVTDYRNTEVLPEVPAGVQDVYRAPLNRMHGNEMARRYPDGSLDIDYMKHKVLDALYKVKNGIQPNSLEELCLSILFPSVFSYIDPSLAGDLAKVNMKITPEEGAMVAMAVAEHLSEMFTYLKHARQ